MAVSIKVNQLKYTGNGTYDVSDRIVNTNDITSIKKFIDHRSHAVYRFSMKDGENFAAIMKSGTPVTWQEING